MAGVVTPQRPRFRDVLGIAEFRVLLIAQAQSRAGDQIARVAIALLVYDRTRSAALTTLVYALTYLPPMVGGLLLSGLADRYPRRAVMVLTDLVRAVLVTLMVIPGLPLLVISVLLVLLTCLQPLFNAARKATIPLVVPGDTFPTALSIDSGLDFVAQIAGFTTGGVLVAFLGGPHAALSIDAATYVVSATLVRLGSTVHRPGGDSHTAVPGRLPTRGLRVISGDRRLGSLAGLLWLFGCYVAPTALAAPYAHQVGASPAIVGILMGADLPGAILGGLLVARLRPAGRARLMVPLAVATGLPLIATALTPPIPLTILLWAICGALSSYMLLAQVALTESVPDGVRASTLGVVSAGLQTAQGLGILLAGALAEVLPPSASIALCAALGTCGAAIISVIMRRGNPEMLASSPLPWSPASRRQHADRVRVVVRPGHVERHLA
jgi:MFS family permease